MVRRRYQHFTDLIYELLEYDPKRRIKARQALRQQFFFTDYSL
jgi:serine/threonine protein kinase